MSNKKTIKLWDGYEDEKGNFIKMGKELIYDGLRNIDAINNPMVDEVGYRKYQAMQHLDWLKNGGKFYDEYNAEMMLYRLYQVKEIIERNGVEFPHHTKPSDLSLL